MEVNAQKSGIIHGSDRNQLKIVIDAQTRAEAESEEARKLAQKSAADYGFVNSGLNALPVIGPVGADGEIIDDARVLDPNVEVTGFRAEFLFVNMI